MSCSTPMSRVLIFNCTHGRSAMSLLDSVLTKLSAQLQLHTQEDGTSSFFDHVIFCTNVTYQDGGFKGGTQVFRYHR